jgi:rhamnosyltransferase
VSSPPPRASVIVRTKDSARTLGRALSLLRAQTVPAEIIVVDSGSTDDTLAMAHGEADQVIEIRAEEFTFGRALNVGAAAARAPIHFALSSHAVPPDELWIERSLAKYERADVAGTCGAPTQPGSSAPLTTTVYQSLELATEHPYWGFSNTASSWRAEVWERMPFDEALVSCEDKEWAFRVLAAGWTIAVDSKLAVGDSHRRQYGLRHLYRRTRLESEAIASFAPVPPTTLTGFLHEWQVDVPSASRLGRWRRRVSPSRFTELLAKHRGHRAAAARTPRS